ncbi:MAG: hypothetical protein COU29_01135 [Candidatus Magasanikbacteria bacterium CG10_big_fil_rev_8_21_14_0_10_36_32]|uniref:Dickkopf N-terminal cysteine-rich domain-containing protein n=1 Tax=Candidatus Magasanikbacteria bacterium CG10_big_fil_rev_8_21_14_0_10_36_32 TaxID=1974646 RepID=A0A2M6W6F6_9BACT|nr:MAG: hypothetical protein COU29_01135 [Candidatus Magasanikbacteria bacterium CG10_big_fil_rev_8_21_14_0_10_36_32]
MYFKKVFFFLVFSVILFPLTVDLVLAQTGSSIIQSENYLCWKKEDCVQARQEMAGELLASDGWIQEEPCTGEWGKCLAGRATKTSISFGGKSSFANLGDYIKTIYNYALVALGVLAVVMIIVSGVQWITSAGSSEVIGQSKKRIGGAVIGLFIAFMSYNILNSINPALVNLRLPQIWMLRAEPELSVAAGDYCDPRGGETKTACEADGQHICFTIGYDSDRQGACAVLAEYISTVSVSFVGGAASIGAGAEASIGKELANGAKTVLSKGGTKILSFATKIPAKELANYSKSQAATAVLKNVGSKVFSFKGLKWGATAVGAVWACDKVSDASADSISCGKIVVSTASGIVEYAVDEFVDFFANHNGVCLPKAEALQNGEMCDVNKNQCAEGHCVKMKGVTAAFKCWAKTEIGFCSDGKNGSQCYNVSDCAAGLKCVEDAYVPLCSNGLNGSPCGKASDCKSDNCNKDRCVGGVLEDGDWCSDTAECNSASECIGLMNCGPNYQILTPGVCEKECQLWDLSANKLWEGKWGVCIPVKQTGKINILKTKMQLENDAPASNDVKCSGY